MTAQQVSSQCPICQQTIEATSIAKAALSGPREYNLLSCPHCAAVYFDPIPTPDELQNHYSKGYSFYKTNDYKAEGKGMAFAHKYLQQYKEGNFLDIGCANGYFLSGVEKASNLNVYGTDINPEVVSIVKEKLNLDIRAGEIEDIAFEEGFFDFIHVQDVLEHVPDPMRFLHECRRILKQDGSLFLSVPNGLSDMQGLIKYSAMYHSPAFSGAGHIYFFSADCLNFMFETAGFKVDKVYSFNFKKGLRNFSILPDEKHWKENLTPPSTNSDSVVDEQPEQHIEDANQKQRSLSYYKFRFFKDELARLPGTHKYGNDFIYLLKPL